MRDVSTARGSAVRYVSTTGGENISPKLYPNTLCQYRTPRRGMVISYAMSAHAACRLCRDQPRSVPSYAMCAGRQHARAVPDIASHLVGRQVSAA
eukprot:1230245-Rhodomonas_salina.1